MRIGLGIPSFGGVPGEAFPSHLAAACDIGRVGDLVTLTPVDIAPHDKAREMIWNGALQYNCDLLFFIDCDVIVPTGAFDMLLKALRETGAAMVAGSCPRRGFPYTTTWFRVLNNRVVSIEELPGVEPIAACGLCCNLIDLTQLRDIPGPFFRQGYMSQHGEFTPEDAFFCAKLRSHQKTIMGHPGVKCVHLGERLRISFSNSQELRAMYLQNNQPQPSTDSSETFSPELVVA